MDDLADPPAARPRPRLRLAAGRCAALRGQRWANPECRPSCLAPRARRRTAARHGRRRRRAAARVSKGRRGLPDAAGKLTMAAALLRQPLPQALPASDPRYRRVVDQLKANARRTSAHPPAAKKAGDAAAAGNGPPNARLSAGMTE